MSYIHAVLEHGYGSLPRPTMTITEEGKLKHSRDYPERTPREKVYLIGALKNPEIPHIANKIQAAGHQVFADWFSPGAEADTKWQEYEGVRGRRYRDAIYGPHALHAFDFDKKHLDECTVGVLVMPAGKSGHLELGYLAGTGKRTYILFDGEPERFDLMYLFANYVCFSVDELLKEIASPTPVQRNWDKVSGFT